MGLTGAFLGWDCGRIDPLSPKLEPWSVWMDEEGVSLRPLIPLVGIGLFGRGGSKLGFALEVKSGCGLGWLWLADRGKTEGK